VKTGGVFNENFRRNYRPLKRNDRGDNDIIPRGLNAIRFTSRPELHRRIGSEGNEHFR